MTVLEMSRRNPALTCSSHNHAVGECHAMYVGWYTCHVRGVVQGVTTQRDGI